MMEVFVGMKLYLTLMEYDECEAAVLSVTAQLRAPQGCSQGCFQVPLEALRLLCSQDSCVRQALRCRRLMRLITLQLHFLGSGQSMRIINLGRQDLPGAILALPRFYQVSWDPSGSFCQEMM